jgi:hypothetical protein
MQEGGRQEGGQSPCAATRLANKRIEKMSFIRLSKASIKGGDYVRFFILKYSRRVARLDCVARATRQFSKQKDEKKAGRLKRHRRTFLDVSQIFIYWQRAESS